MWPSACSGLEASRTGTRAHGVVRAPTTLPPDNNIPGRTLTCARINTMCRAIQCRVCRKKTWAGCGQHVQAVMAGVAADDRCRCTEADRRTHQQENRGLWWRRKKG